MKKSKTLPALQKAPTGISGFDEISYGGLPRGRSSLVCGSAGCGKTLFSLEFLIRGAVYFNEPGVFIAFEEKQEDLVKNVASLGFDLNDLINRKKIFVDFIQVERNEIQEAGAYDLEGLFIRLLSAIQEVGAKRLAIDTLETIFGGFSDQAMLRAELRRLFRFVNERNLTTLITGERGDGALTRQGLEEYVSDCVILLDHRVTDQISTRRLRIVKYRGSVHGTNEYPFLIDDAGFSVLPLSSLSLSHTASNERLSSGVKELDQMMEGKGYFRGSTVLVSGTAGSGKSSLSAHFAERACADGKRALYFAFEESVDQICRNMKSIGKDLRKHIKKGQLQIHSSRPSLYGLEMHLVSMHKTIEAFKPDVVVVDPVTNLIAVGTEEEVNSMLVRLIDFLKMKKITALFTSMTDSGGSLEQTELSISSLIDTWVLLRDMENNGERTRGIYVLKSRGMAHSNQIREFVITRKGITLREPYLGPQGMAFGSARVSMEAHEKSKALVRKQEFKRLEVEAARKRKVLEAQILALQAEIEAQDVEMQSRLADEAARLVTVEGDRIAMGKQRKLSEN